MASRTPTSDPPASPAAAPASASLRRFFTSMVQTLRWRLLWVLALGFVGGIAAGVGLVMLVPLLDLVGVDAGGGSTGAIADAVSVALDRVGLCPSVPVLLSLNLVVLTLAAAVVRTQTIASTALYQAFVRAQRTRLFDALTFAEWRVLTGERGSNQAHLLIGEAERLGAAALSAMNLVSRATLALVHVVVAFVISPAMTALVALSSLLLVAATRPLARRARARGQDVSDAYRDLYGAVDEHLSGLKTVKGHGIEQAQVARFADRANRTSEAMIALTRNQADVGFWLKTGSAVVLTAIVYVALDVARVPPAGLLVMLYLFARLVPMLSGLQRSYQSLANDLPAVQRVSAATEAFEASAESDGAGEPVTALRAGMTLEEVAFTYRGEEQREVLRGVNLVIPAGSTTAIVGPSGGGKSTLVDLLIGLIAPDRGSIRVDGAALDGAFRRVWRRHVSFVPQDVFLFHDSVRENLLVARSGATEAEMWEALEAASADFVRDLPDGLDTVVGDRGSRLSGGERQRLALARALLRKPALLVLDEATSNLDAANEARVQEAVARLHGRTTMVVIAHRLATVRDADTIHVLVDGRITESGTWPELVDRPDGVFRHLAAAQGLAAAAAQTGR